MRPIIYPGLGIDVISSIPLGNEAEAAEWKQQIVNHGSVVLFML
jgi:hypothetical protein